MPSVRVEEAPDGDRAVAHLFRMARTERKPRGTDSPALRVGEDDVHAPGDYVVVAWSDDEAVGCASFRPLGAGAVEVRSVFVIPVARGCGIARQMLAHLEAGARTRGYARVAICAGRVYPEAAVLYRSSGYDEVAAGEAHAGSVCFTKSLSVSPERSVWRWLRPKRQWAGRPMPARSHG